MRSLDEMRPKIVELTEIKLELGEKVEGLERALRSRDGTISQLESSLDEVRNEKEQTEKHWEERLDQREKEHSLAQLNSTEMQKAYAELQEELDSSLASIRTLEADRSNHHQETSRRLQDIERLTASSSAQAEELTALRQEVDERRNDQVRYL